MTVPQKAFLSFLPAFFLVAGIMVFASSGFFGLLEDLFHNPSVSKSLVRKTAGDAALLDAFLSELQNRFSSSLDEPAVRRSFLPEPNASDVFERSKVFSLLHGAMFSLHSVRFVNPDSKEMSFSTCPADIAGHETSSGIYRKYHEDSFGLPFGEVSVFPQEQVKLTLDKTGGRIIFSLPFYDSLDIYRGVALFSVSAGALSDVLFAAGRMGAGDNLALVKNPDGFVTGLPDGIQENIAAGGYRNIIHFISDGTNIAVVSVQMEQGLFFGRTVSGSVFVLPQSIKILIFIALFLTIFLIVFFLIGIKPVFPAKFAGNDTMPPYLNSRQEAPGDLDIDVDTAELEYIPVEVIIEQDGIHYINSSAVNSGIITDEKLNRDFVKLVESVVDKT
jgi:hypothetical protein